GLRKYKYERETIWRIPRELATRLFLDFGHGSAFKKLPFWCFHLSHRQALLLWHHAVLGDGTFAPNGDVYYTTNEVLAGNLQAMLISAGDVCSVRGPYYYPEKAPTFGEAETYQVYRPYE